MKILSPVQTAKLLGVSIEDLHLLEEQDLLHSSKDHKGRIIYSPEEVAQIKSRKVPSISEEAELVNIQVQRETAYSVTTTKKVLFFVGGVVSSYILLIIVFTVLFIINPLQTAGWLGYVRGNSLTSSLSQAETRDMVLGANTDGAISRPTRLMRTFLQPASRASLGIVKAVSPNAYQEVAKITILDPNDVFAVENEVISPQMTLRISDNSKLEITDPVQIPNLNSEYLQGLQPGSNPGDIAIVGDTPSLSLVPVTNVTATGLTNANLSGSAGITNANLANSSITINTSSPLSGGGAVALGSSLTLTCPTCTNGSSLFTADSTDTLTNKTIDVTLNTITGLTASNLAAGDFSSKITSGTYSIDITGSIASAVDFTGSLAGDVSGTQNLTTVTKINGTTLGSTTATSGNLLIGSGSQWVTQTVSNDATINSLGVLTLKNVGTSGTYGSGSLVPVFTTDAKGRISGVTNTTISGLSPTNFSYANISQWTNDAGYVTSLSEADTLATVTGRGATTSNALTLSNVANAITAGTLTIQAENFTDLTGSGLSNTAGVLGVNLTTSGTTGSTTSNSGLEVSTSGLTLLKGCTDEEILKYTDAGGWACAADVSGGTPALSTIGAAVGANLINSGDNAQIWNWGLTTAAKTAFTFGENTAAINGAGSQYILSLSTLSGSTAAPLIVSARGNAIITTSETGGLTFGNTTANTAITLQSGTGTINIGTDANAKILTLGNSTGATAVNIDSGSGNINFTVNGTGSSGKVQIGNSNTITPDLLVLDNGTADPAGVNGGMYYNTSTNKFRCYQNSGWSNCITPPGSDLQTTATYGTNDSLVNVGVTQVTIAAVSITPASVTGDIYVRGRVEIFSSNNTDQSLVLSIEDDATCTGNTVETNTITITASNGTQIGNFELADVVVDAGASAHSYSLCASTATGDSDLRLYEMFATVIDTGADLAEIYTTDEENIEVGDVVSLESGLQAGMKKSQTAYDQSVLGIVSTRPGLIIGDVGKEGVRALPVAMSGRVPVKVSTTNGRIDAGDYLTTSEIPGVAMKSTKGGAIIGIAMNSFDGEGIGRILAFAKNGSSTETVANVEKIATSSASLIEGNILNRVIQIITDLFKNSVEFLGSVVFHSDITFLGRPTFNKDTAGYALIKAGSREVNISFEKAYTKKPVITVSLSLSEGVKLDDLPLFAVYESSSQGFKIRLSRATISDLQFSWIAIEAAGEVVLSTESSMLMEMTGSLEEATDSDATVASQSAEIGL